MNDFTALDPITFLARTCAQLSLFQQLPVAQQGFREGAVFIHVHKAGTILCCSIINLHQCPAITLPCLVVEVRPLDQPVLGCCWEVWVVFF